MFFRCLSLVVSLVLVSCDPMTNPAILPRHWDLLAADQLQHWTPTGIPEEGRTTVSLGEALLEPGGPLTGLRYGNWQKAGLPVRDYAVSFEATRIEGGDFFAAVTFPVRSLDTCATLVIGGWGGGLVGISSIDGQDASENSTRGEHLFENGKAYHFRLEVREDELKAWLDDRLVINTSIKGRTISLRPGYIEKCAPFGLATYSTNGRIRNVSVMELK
jgi:hypothetical protein